MRFVLVLLLLIPFVLADPFVTDEAQTILTSDSLQIKQTISTETSVNGDLNWLEVNHGFYPKETYRQSILSESFDPKYHSKNDTNIVFRMKNPSSLAKTSSTYVISTKNEYKQIQGDVPFPLSNIPDDVKPYLQETTFIDITPEIRTTASLIASGKNDLFQVSQDVASWVVTNIEYDLSTLTEDAVQKASWVIKNRQGVCDELSILYISMMRSLGIPARYVSGISYTNSELFVDNWNPHAWTEVYFPSYGWVPFDLTYQQFGYIDASHITFSTSVDAGNILTSYQWQGYDLDQTDIELSETIFSQEIQSTGNPVDEGFTYDVTPLYKTVGLDSYNILKINVENTKNYYVSSTLYISSPREVTLDKAKIPIYVKPNDEKTYYVLMSLSGLSSGYSYTLPINVFTAFGSSEESEFTAASRYSHISLQQVNAYLSENIEDTSKNSFSLQCSAEKETVLPDENVDVICTAVNNGNVYLTDGRLCFNSVCQDLTIDIGGTVTNTFIVSENAPSEYVYDVTASFENVQETQQVKVIVKDVANISIDSISFDSVIPGKALNGSVTLKKDSLAIPTNIDLRISINGDLYSWNLDQLPQSTEVQIPLHSYLLQDGENVVEVFVSWEDLNGGQHYVEKSSSISVDFSFMDKIKSWIFKLGY